MTTMGSGDLVIYNWHYKDRSRGIYSNDIPSQILYDVLTLA